ETEALNDVEDHGWLAHGNDNLHVDPELSKNALKRKGKYSSITSVIKGEKELEIEHRLRTPVNLNFTDQSLESVIEELSSWHNINIVPDFASLDQEGISLKRPVTLKVQDISLKSALELLLHNLHLTYVLQDEVLLITTERHAVGKQVTTTYP